MHTSAGYRENEGHVLDVHFDPWVVVFFSGGV